ncbi:histone-lysine N-methyltransferase SETMAR [Trichonephila clavata]|uniref:Histone-lysine N-methyltransferase SETMAR n=1 Tax=Trichonephila clavata TaxID=2740835 RepID=A0A8X6FA30_TRICU|nr:histone-lysine N-methyltransferase SETMAR [Trichonephila clavata]
MERRCVLNSWSKEEVRAVIRYEWARGVSGTEIHNRLVEVYGLGVVSKQMVRRWCRTFSDGRQQVEDMPRAGRTRTATTDANVGKVDDMIRANRRITIDEVAEELGISHERAQNIIHDILRYRKVSARWVPRQLTSTHQEQRMAVSLEHLVEASDTSKTCVASRGWFNRFKHRNNLHNIHITAEAASGDTKAEEFPATLKTLIVRGKYHPELVFNVEETGRLFWKRIPKRTFLSLEERHAPGFKKLQKIA